LRQEAGEKREEEEGRSQKKCFYKYEMLPNSSAFSGKNTLDKQITQKNT